MPSTAIDFIRDSLDDIKARLDRIEAKVDRVDPERCRVHDADLAALREENAKRIGATSAVTVGWARVVAIAAIIGAIVACGNFAMVTLRSTTEVPHVEIAKPR